MPWSVSRAAQAAARREGNLTPQLKLSVHEEKSVCRFSVAAFGLTERLILPKIGKNSKHHGPRGNKALNLQNPSPPPDACDWSAGRSHLKSVNADSFRFKETRATCELSIDCTWLLLKTSGSA